MIPECFVCGSCWICEHREVELIPFWQAVTGDEPVKTQVRLETPRKLEPLPETGKLQTPVDFLKPSGFRISVSAEDSFRQKRA